MIILKWSALLALEAICKTFCDVTKPAHYDVPKLDT